jgi:hypothetical protein
VLNADETLDALGLSRVNTATVGSPDDLESGSLRVASRVAQDAKA